MKNRWRARAWEVVALWGIVVFAIIMCVVWTLLFGAYGAYACAPLYVAIVAVGTQAVCCTIDWRETCR